MLPRWAAVVTAMVVVADAASKCHNAPGTCSSQRTGGEDGALLQASSRVRGSSAAGAGTGAATGAALEAAVLGHMAHGLAPGVLSGSLARTAAAAAGGRDGSVEPPEYDAETVQLPWTLGLRPLAHCPEGKDSVAVAAGDAEADLAKAVRTFCDVGLGEYVEFYVDPRYQATHERVRSADGWIDQAYMTYYGTAANHSSLSGEEDILVQSLHHFSDKPVVVINFGKLVPKSWSPERFPNMVLMHAKKSTLRSGVSFNMNKLTAMMFTKIRTGIQLDADQWANRGLDLMFRRAEEEITADYPYPILPVHWMSRDSESSDMEHLPPRYAWTWKNPETPKQTMRWLHSHPTWTHYALPWIAKWSALVLAPEEAHAPQWLRDQGFWSDEPILNVAAWHDGLTKQWCKFDIPSPRAFDDYAKQVAKKDIDKDSKYYPKGIAYMYFSAHGATDPEKSYEWMQRLWGPADPPRMAIAYDGRWFASADELRAYDPHLRCIV